MDNSGVYLSGQVLCVKSNITIIITKNAYFHSKFTHEIVKKIIPPFLK